MRLAGINAYFFNNILYTTNLNIHHFDELYYITFIRKNLNNNNNSLFNLYILIQKTLILLYLLLF